ncbi:MAG: hypothetical protein SGJ23_13505 [Alphaproteobacteria bacterium]|nr:hypothetical protein [Alphaproteobacteria bacterium]
MLETLKQSVAFPADASLIAHTHTLTTPFGNVDVSIPLSDLKETVRDPATLGGDTAAALTAPAAINGAIASGVDEHRYTWEAKKGDFWSIEAQSRAVGGRLDVAVVVLGPDGKQVAESDDMPGTTDAALEVRAAADGVHTCIIRSVGTRQGSADEIYRLAIKPSAPDFALAVPQQVNLPLGGKVEVVIVATRIGGFDGEIAIAVDGLPEGVTLAPPAAPAGTEPKPIVIPAGKKDVKITLQSAADAAVVARMIQVRGTAKVGETAVTRVAFAPATGNLASRSPAEQRVADVLLAMTMAPPYEVLILDRERQREVHRGTTYLAEFDVARKEGFAGEVRIEMTAAQARYRHGMRGPIVTVPAGATRGAYPIFLPEWLPTDVTQRMNVHGVASVADPKGKTRYLTKAADARITMIMEGALLKLSTEPKHVEFSAGESFEVPVLVSRSAKLPLEVTVELVVPDEIKGLLRAEPLVLKRDVNRGVLRISSVADARLEGAWSITLKATALEDGKWPIVSQVDLPVTGVKP